jgi:hypothetical protein
MANQTYKNIYVLADGSIRMRFNYFFDCAAGI